MTASTPPTTALLVVHLQHDIVSSGTAFGDIFSSEVRARDVLAQCDKAMATVREGGGLVVPLRIAFEEDHSNLNPSLPLLQMVAQAGCLKDGSEGAEIVPEINVGPNDLVLTHQRPGPFTNTDLLQNLAERGIQNIVVCGVATNASVEGAARQAADLGFNTFVLSDACSAANETAHEAALDSLGLFAQIITINDLAPLLN